MILSIHIKLRMLKNLGTMKTNVESADGLSIRKFASEIS